MKNLAFLAFLPLWGQEVAYAKTFAEVGAKSYEIQFVALRQVISKDFDMFPKDFAKVLVQNELLTRGGFNPEAERRVLADFGQTTVSYPIERYYC